MRRRLTAVAVPALALTALAAVQPASAGPAGRLRQTHPSPAAAGHNSTFGAGPASARGKGPVVPDGRPQFQFFSSAGGRSSDHLAVINPTRRTERLNVYTVDAAPDSDGRIGYLPRSDKPQQAGAWIAVGTPHARPFIVLRPRSTAILPVRLRLPENASPGDHVGGIVVSITGKAVGRIKRGGSSSKQNVNFEQRLVVPVDIRVSGPLHPRLTVVALRARYDGPVDPFARGHASVTYEVHNGGNVVLGGPQQLGVTGLFGESVPGVKLPAVPSLLPGATYRVAVQVPRVYPQVIMHVHVAVRPVGLPTTVTPGLRAVSASATFLAVPWIPVALVLLLVLLAGYGAARRIRRKRRTVTAPAGRHRAPVTQGA